MLHVTNGDSVVESFRDGNIPGTYLPWRDVLHDGAVPQRDSLQALSFVRARELVRIGVGSDDDYDTIHAEFVKRDDTLARFRQLDEVVLWFEHDLYDQLQLLQILDWLSLQDRAGAQLSMIQIGSHPDVTPFYGLGQLTGVQLAALLPARKPITPRQLEIGRAAWAAFTADTASGARVFAASCAKCHGAVGEGTAGAPPLWGPESYNVGAGMSRVRTAAEFISRNMPFDVPGTLSDSQAFNVAAYVNAHPRPDYRGKENDWPNGDSPPDVAYPTRSHH